MLLLSAFAITFLTLLGEAGEDLGMDRLLKSNTARKRVRSLFRLGRMLYELMPGMPASRPSSNSSISEGYSGTPSQSSNLKFVFAYRPNPLI